MDSLLGESRTLSRENRQRGLLVWVVREGRRCFERDGNHKLQGLTQPAELSLLAGKAVDEGGNLRQPGRLDEGCRVGRSGIRQVETVEVVLGVALNPRDLLERAEGLLDRSLAMARRGLHRPCLGDHDERLTRLPKSPEDVSKVGNERVVEEFDRHGEEHEVRCLESLLSPLVVLGPISVDARSVDESDVAVPVVLRDLVGRDARADRDVEGPVGERFDQRRLPAAVIAGKHQERRGVCLDRRDGPAAARPPQGRARRGCREVPCPSHVPSPRTL